VSSKLASRDQALQIRDARHSMSFDESIAYTESQIELLAMTEDAKEGLKAFGEKRKPSWPGK
jgi:enoyl-CoA hydratase/carnithine racemase